MTLGIFLALGDSFYDMEKVGQATRFKKFYLNRFAQEFDKVYVFTYRDETVNGLPGNVEVVPNRSKRHRYIYGLLLPFIHRSKISECEVLRAYHIHGTIPAIISRIFFGKEFSFNYAYDYAKDAALSKKWLQVIFYKATIPLSVSLASRIFAANKQIVGLLPKSKTVYMPNGVDVSFFKLRDSSRETVKKIISVGRLETVKNYTNLVKALEGLPLELTLVGNGSLKKELISQAKKLKVKLKIIDKVDNVRMPSLYKTADIFVLPSLSEGHPKVLLEAMSVGLPVIGSKVEGIKDIIQDGQNGLLSGIDSQSINQTLKILMKNKKLRREISKSGRETIVKNFSLENLLTKEINIIKKI